MIKKINNVIHLKIKVVNYINYFKLYILYHINTHLRNFDTANFCLFITSEDNSLC